MSKQDMRKRHDWDVTLYVEKDSFFAECTSPEGNSLRTESYKDKGTAWQQGYNLVDRAVQEARARRYEAIAMPLTLMLLYVAGSDEYYDNSFFGRRARKGYDVDILNALEAEGLIKPQSNRKTVQSVLVNNDGINLARELLRNLNLAGVDELLDDLADRDSI